MMLCDNCGREGLRMVEIEPKELGCSRINVSTITACYCPKCGEVWLNPITAAEIEQDIIKRVRQHLYLS